MGHFKGLVEEVGEGENLGKVRVRFPQFDDLVSDWLPVMHFLTFGAKDWNVPRKDTQVVVLPGQEPGSGLEDAVVLGAIFSKVDRPPFDDPEIIGLVADDGVEFSYNPNSSTLTIKSPKLIDIVSTDIRIVSDVEITGDIKHTGDTKQTGNVTHTGNTTQTGTLTNTETTSSGIALTTHKHVGVMGGPGNTGVPVP